MNYNIDIVPAHCICIEEEQNKHLEDNKVKRLSSNLQ